jgi:hypothetical protein
MARSGIVNKEDLTNKEIMFSKEIIDAIRAAARANHWPESALLAVVECETSGDPFEQDNRTPRLLFERHKFYSEMKQHEPSKLQRAIAAGLAIPKWSRSTQYKDQGSSGNRLKLIAKARASMRRPTAQRPGASVRRWVSTPSA